MPVTSAIIIFSKAHGMSYVTHVSNNNLRNHSSRNFFYWVHKIIPIYVTRLLGNECKTVSKKPLAVPSQKVTRRKKRTKTRVGIAKIFALHTNAKK